MFRWNLIAAHFDHGVRSGGGARARAVHERLPPGVQWRTARAAASAGTTQAEWRAARYDWLARVAGASGAVRIATGHHRDDQVETILFRLLRHTGNRGLVGIPERRGNIVRPLLPFTSRELRDWLALRGVGYEEDPANADPRHARNRIRHALLPALEESLGQDVRDTLLRLGRRAADVEDGVAALARRGVAHLSTGEIARMPEFVRAEALRLAARSHGVRLRGRAALRLARRLPTLQSGRGLDMGGGLRLEREFDAWRVTPATPGEASEPDAEVTIAAPGPGSATLRLGGRARRLRWGTVVVGEAASGEGVAPTAGAGRCVALFVGPDHYPLKVRRRRHGDRIRLEAGSRNVSKLMAADRIPASARDGVPVVADRTGAVLCVLSEPARIAEPSRLNVNLMIEVEDE